MKSTQPVNLLSYLSLKKTHSPKGVKKIFYLSWEDAVWDLLDKKGVKKGSLVLVPDFYCTDVENNFLSRGFRVEHYILNKNLKVNKPDFIRKLKNLNPAVIIIFHPVGIRSNLMDNKKWVESLSNEQILIEDSVHRIINPAQLSFLRRNHFVVDSLRKVVPLQGSNLFGMSKDMNFLPSKSKLSLYSMKIHLYWTVMILCWTLGLGVWAEKLMLKSYDLIGDSPIPSRGFWLFEFLYNYLDFFKIKETKITQVRNYEKNLSTDIFTNPKYSVNDRGEIRGWPVILDKKIAESVLTFLRENGLMVRFELEESIWSKKYKIMYLPLGMHIKPRDQEVIIDLVGKCNIICGNGKK